MRQSPDCALFINSRTALENRNNIHENVNEQNATRKMFATVPFMKLSLPIFYLYVFKLGT
jgi:hypothetical protein